MSSNRRPKRTLVVDDQTLICNVVREALVQDGHEVEVVRDGAAALQTYRPERFTLLVMDIVMPLKTGIEVVRELRRRGDLVPVVLMSSHMSEEVARATEGLANLVLLPKPFGIGKLRASVEKAVSTITC